MQADSINTALHPCPKRNRDAQFAGSEIDGPQSNNSWKMHDVENNERASEVVDQNY